jgi:F0F1-type ATP synthase assembly protein I
MVQPFDSRKRSEPLWDRIDRNRLKTAAFVTAFVLAAALSAGVIVAVIGVFLGVVLVSPAGFEDYFRIYPYLIAGALAIGAALAVVHVVRTLTGPHRKLPKLFGAVRSDTGTMLPTKSALHDMPWPPATATRRRSGSSRTAIGSTRSPSGCPSATPSSASRRASPSVFRKTAREPPSRTSWRG